MKLYLNTNINVFYNNYSKKYLFSDFKKKIEFKLLFRDKKFEQFVYQLKKMGVYENKMDNFEKEIVFHLKKIPNFIINNKFIPEKRYTKTVDYLYANQLSIENYKKINDLTICIIGIGSLGGNILLQMLTLGYRKFIICDGDKIEESNLNRQIIYSPLSVGKYKVEEARNWVKINHPNANIVYFKKFIRTKSDYMKLPKKVDLLILTADEPYKKIVGLTSNFCNKYKIPWIRINRDGFGPLKTYTNTNVSCPKCKEINEKTSINKLTNLNFINYSPGSIIMDVFFKTAQFTNFIFNFHLQNSNKSDNIFFKFNSLPSQNLLNKQIVKKNDDCGCTKSL